MPASHRFRFSGLLMVIFGISLTGCVSEPSRSYSRDVVNTYAELTMLYENEKMEKKVTDSLYQISVSNFFVTKGVDQKEFKLQIEEITKNPEDWKFFIQDVTGTIDSLKNIK